MSSSELQATIDQAWEDRDSISPDTTGVVRDAIEAALDGLDSGDYRVADMVGGNGPVIGREVLDQATPEEGPGRVAVDEDDRVTRTAIDHVHAMASDLDPAASGKIHCHLAPSMRQ